jgi:hypothetical protein
MEPSYVSMFVTAAEPGDDSSFLPLYAPAAASRYDPSLMGRPWASCATPTTWPGIRGLGTGILLSAPLAKMTDKNIAQALSKIKRCKGFCTSGSGTCAYELGEEVFLFSVCQQQGGKLHPLEPESS